MKAEMIVEGATHIPKRTIVGAVIFVTAGDPRPGMMFRSPEADGKWRLNSYGFAEFSEPTPGRYFVAFELLDGAALPHDGMRLVEMVLEHDHIHTTC